MIRPRLSEHDYLRQIELLACDVIHHAYDEGLLAEETPEPTGPLHRALTELAHELRHFHFDGDGCLDDDRPTLHLGGAALLNPGTADGDYETACSRLGVEPRAEGWALWCTWDDDDHPHTIVTTARETTEELFTNWSRGLDVHPARPARAQIAAVVEGWIEPITLSPGQAKAIGLGGR